MIYPKSYWLMLKIIFGSLRKKKAETFLSNDERRYIQRKVNGETKA